MKIAQCISTITIKRDINADKPDEPVAVWKKSADMLQTTLKWFLWQTFKCLMN